MKVLNTKLILYSAHSAACRKKKKKAVTVASVDIKQQKLTHSLTQWVFFLVYREIRNIPCESFGVDSSSRLL